MRKWLVGIIGFSVICFFGYQYAVSIAADKMVDEVSKQFANEEEIDKLMAHPKIQEEMAKLEEKNTRNTDDKDNGDSKDNNSLAFATKEEALKAITKRLSAKEVKELSQKVMNGVTPEEKKEIEDTLKEKLTPEEFEAIKILALFELKKDSNK